MRKKKIWYQKRWVKLRYRRGIIINKDSLFFNKLLPRYWNSIELDIMFFYSEVGFDLFNIPWQQNFLLENFYELYKSFNLLIISNSYWRFFFLLNLFFYFFKKIKIRLLVKELIKLNIRELFWIIFSLKFYVNKLIYLKIIWKYFLNIKISKSKLFRTKWNLIWKLLWSYEKSNTILEKNDSKKYKLKNINKLFIFFNLYFLESFFSKIVSIISKIWLITLNLQYYLIISIQFLNDVKIKMTFLFLENFKILKYYSFEINNNFVLMESKFFLEKVTFFSSFRKMNWIKLYFKLKFKQQVIKN